VVARGLPTQLLWTERGLSHLPPDWRQILFFHGFCQSLLLKNAVAVQGIIHYANLRSTANRTAGLFWPRFRERELELHWVVATSRNISTVSQSDCRLNNDRCADLVRTHLALHCIHVILYLAIAYERGAAHAHMCTARTVGGARVYEPHPYPESTYTLNCACPIDCSTRGALWLSLPGGKENGIWRLKIRLWPPGLE